MDALNKDGELLLYDRNAISAGPRHRRLVAANSPQALIPLYGVPAFDPATRTLVLVSPSTPPTRGLRAGVQALRLTSSCTFTADWWHSFDPPAAGSAPTIADGVVYLASGRNGFLRAYRLRDGDLLWSQHPTHAAILAAPAIAHGTLFAAGWDGNVWAYRLSR